MNCSFKPPLIVSHAQGVNAVICMRYTKTYSSKKELGYKKLEDDLIIKSYQIRSRRKESTSMELRTVRGAPTH